MSRVSRSGQMTGSSVRSVAQSSGGNSSRSFQQQLGSQLKEQYRERVTALFNEINEQAAHIVETADMVAFEKYRRLIAALLEEVTNNAYRLESECVLDPSGRQRVYEIIRTIDKKLENLAADILSRNSKHIDYICRMDEIRGLIMDMLL
ncbi:MAG: YaaR family protein [Oscillospiraceae bacterium]